MLVSQVLRIWVVALALSLSGCAPLAESLPVLRVGTSGDYAPFSRGGAGFDVDVARLLAADLGYRVEWVPFRWPELTAAMRDGSIDVAMSGVTWRPDRAVLGYMTRAVAVGGPCVLGAAQPKRVGVNRGGVLERFARARFPDTEIVTVDDNLSLPQLLSGGRVDAIVTDSFELPTFRRPGTPERCEPRRDRKVYWVAPAKAQDLGPRIDRWLVQNESLVAELRDRWLGETAPRTELDHLADLVDRRMALMPAVAAWKRERQEPISDPEREAQVIQGVAVQAGSLGLAPESVTTLFDTLIGVARAVQSRAPEAPASLDLGSELRPLIGSLGNQILVSLAALPELPPDRDALRTRIELSAGLLTETEREAVVDALLRVRRLPRTE